MDNPIIVELNRLFPSIKPTSAQHRATQRATNPQEVANSLEAQVQGLEELFEKKIGYYEDKDIVANLILDRPIKSFGNVSAGSLLFKLGPERAYELGRLSNDYWRNLYLKYKKSEPDSAGLSWWKNTVEYLFKLGLKK